MRKRRGLRAARECCECGGNTATDAVIALPRANYAAYQALVRADAAPVCRACSPSYFGRRASVSSRVCCVAMATVPRKRWAWSRRNRCGKSAACGSQRDRNQAESCLLRDLRRSGMCGPIQCSFTRVLELSSLQVSAVIADVFVGAVCARSQDCLVCTAQVQRRVPGAGAGRSLSRHPY
jgi:hypothetical protein